MTRKPAVFRYSYSLSLSSSFDLRGKLGLTKRNPLGSVLQCCTYVVALLPGLVTVLKVFNVSRLESVRVRRCFKSHGPGKRQSTISGRVGSGLVGLCRPARNGQTHESLGYCGAGKKRNQTLSAAISGDWVFGV